MPGLFGNVSSRSRQVQGREVWRYTTRGLLSGRRRSGSETDGTYDVCGPVPFMSWNVWTPGFQDGPLLVLHQYHESHRPQDRDDPHTGRCVDEVRRTPQGRELVRVPDVPGPLVVVGAPPSLGIFVVRREEGECLPLRFRVS